MSLVEHLEELRRRLFWCLIFWAIGICFALYFRHFFIELILKPHAWAMGSLDQKSSLHIFRYQDNFIAQLKIALTIGFLISFLPILFQVLSFISAGLYPKEKQKLFFTYLPALFILFLVGGAFGYFYLIPYGLYFLAQFGLDVGLTQVIGFGDYISLFLLLVLLTGVLFELPVFMVLLTRLGWVNALFWRRQRSFAIFSSFVLGAILTPPDPVTQIFMAVPLIILYEAGIWTTYLLEKKSKEMLSLP